MSLILTSNCLLKHQKSSQRHKRKGIFGALSSVVSNVQTAVETTKQVADTAAPILSAVKDVVQSTYGRGAGYPWKFGDPFGNLENAKQRCL